MERDTGLSKGLASAGFAIDDCKHIRDRKTGIADGLDRFERRAARGHHVFDDEKTSAARESLHALEPLARTVPLRLFAHNEGLERKIPETRLVGDRGRDRIRPHRHSAHGERFQARARDQIASEGAHEANARLV